MKEYLEAKRLREEIKSLHECLDKANRSLLDMERSCFHVWQETEYCPEYVPAYTIPGDPPGTMGVDWQGPVHVSAKTIKRWRRVCQLCGKEEITEITKKTFNEQPVF